MANRKKSGRDHWRGVFEEWSASGLSQRGFCEERGISFSTFCYWRRRLRGESEVESQSPFIPVEIKDPLQPRHPSQYEVYLEGGIRIRVPSDFESESLSRLVGLLRCE
ncbi:MAG: hypothetical protein KC944_22370 [Candidatus Omnitrophica bacterium]|nr:hypothetical protein [Candidatus Omnitrophota bacterium]MCA9443462.1 hypothetical protein [Candidatus Omnitrophota bacterium]